MAGSPNENEAANAMRLVHKYLLMDDTRDPDVFSHQAIHDPEGAADDLRSPDLRSRESSFRSGGILRDDRQPRSAG